MLARLHDEGPADLRVDQPVHRAALRRCSPRARPGLPGQAGRRRRLAVGPVAGRAWAWSTSRTPRRRRGSRTSCARLLDQGVDCFKTDFGERIPPRSVLRRLRPAADAQLLHAAVQQGGVRGAARRRAARARRCCSPGRRPPAGSNARCTGAATRPRRSRRWPRPCAAGCRSACRGFGLWSHDIGGFEGTPDAGGLQALDAVRSAVLAQPPARHRARTGCRGQFDDEAVDGHPRLHQAQDCG